MSTKDNEPQVKNLFEPLWKGSCCSLPFSGPWPHPLRVHGVVSLARSLVLEKLPQFLTPGLNFSVFQREIGWLAPVRRENGGLKIEGISGQQLLEAEASLGNHHLNPSPDH